MSDNYFCLDIDEKFTKVVEAKRSGDVIDVTALGKQKLPSVFIPVIWKKSLIPKLPRIKN